jgi:isopenicillin-N N-acyltransferase-like protein
MKFRFSNPFEGKEGTMNRPHSFTQSASISRLLTLFLLAWAVSGLPAVVCAAEIRPVEKPKLVRQFDRAAILEQNGVQILLLAGSPYEMGYQQGALFKPQVQKFIKHILFVAQAAESIKGGGGFNGSLEAALQRAGKFIDKRYFEEMQGLADGAGIDVKDVQLANIFPELFHCSGFALFGKATQGGTLYHGRILDYMTEVGLQDYALLTIAKPKGFNAFVTVGYVGFLGSVTGMNDKQVAFGEMGGRGEGKWDGMPMSFLMRKGFEEAATLDQAVALFRDTPRTCEYYYVISDAKIPDARGLACTPEKCEIIKPNQSHPLLPHAVEDAVLMSADQRYERLAELVKAKHGQIDLNYALDLMNRPVAMESCLHRVLFGPKEQKLWVANAVSPEKTPKFAACYQPYVEFDFRGLLGMIPDSIPAGVEKVPAPSKPLEQMTLAVGSAPAQKLPDITGSVPAGPAQTISAGKSPRQTELLKTYDFPQTEFSYRMEFVSQNDLYKVYRASFPSPDTTDVPENNTVYCEYYMSSAIAKRPAVIVLDILEGSMAVSRIVAHSLASGGVDAAIMTLPHFGPRRSKDPGRYENPAEHLDFWVTSVRQAVKDVRQTARLLAAREDIDASRIGLCGTSLGGFIAALTAGVDGRFPRTAFVLAGGDLATVLTTEAREVRGIRRELQNRGIAGDALNKLVEPIEPLSFADRLGSTKILMINGRTDPIVPPACAEKLIAASASKVETVWYDCDHYGMVRYILPVMGKVCAHFPAKAW